MWETFSPHFAYADPDNIYLVAMVATPLVLCVVQVTHLQAEVQYPADCSACERHRQSVCQPQSQTKFTRHLHGEPGPR